MNSPTNFKCQATDQEVLISFDQKKLRIPLPEAESLQHRLAWHVFYGDGGFDLMGVALEMDNAFILNEVLEVAFEKGDAVAFGEGSVDEWE